MFWCYSYTIIRERINSCLLKLQLLKYSIKIQRCVFNIVVVWLLILGPYWCMCVALIGSRQLQVKEQNVFMLQSSVLFLCVRALKITQALKNKGPT